MLEDNKYMRCLLIDFSKAFDSVDHLTLISTLKGLNIADNIIWRVGGLAINSVSQYNVVRNQYYFIRLSITCYMFLVSLQCLRLLIRTSPTYGSTLKSCSLVKRGVSYVVKS